MVCKTLSEKTLSQKVGLVEWPKVKAWVQAPVVQKKRKPLNVIFVKKISNSLFTWEFILEKDLSNVRSVEKHLAKVHPLFHIRESILVRNLMNARNVGKPSDICPPLLNMSTC
jgi:hypothetical protein